MVEPPRELWLRAVAQYNLGVEAGASGRFEEAIAAYLESLKAHGEPTPPEDILIRPVNVAV